VAVLALMKQLNTRDLPKIMAALKASPKAKARFDAYGLTPVYGARHISSGPGFVTKENIGTVEKFAGQYR
jgi:simple sugar transport system substrate-binding protein